MVILMDKGKADDIEITPDMIEAGVSVFDAWLAEWGYLEDGLPGDQEVNGLIASILASTLSKRPVSRRTRINLRPAASKSFAAAFNSFAV